MTKPVCPIHSNGDVGHDNSSPTFTLMALVTLLLKMVDNGERDGRKGSVEI